MFYNDEMTDAEFGLYQRLIYDICGISLNLSKKQLLMSRLNKRMNNLGLASFKAYRDYVLGDKTGKELTLMIDAISTNKTDFFREPEHFEFLKHKVYPALSSQYRIRIWSAACSSGEEPYTLAITLLEYLNNISKKDVKILATDISTKVLDEAVAGLYSEERLRGIPAMFRQKYFLKGTNYWNGYYRAKEELSSLISFRR
ncbi:MAG: protein-glutamate O-methyltransferase CheR, partial [Desulfobacterales bacterium]|nr:protein-glutamate O-methyltransferase CheR [Desulfobacterales bacterium]